MALTVLERVGHALLVAQGLLLLAVAIHLQKVKDGIKFTLGNRFVVVLEPRPFPIRIHVFAVKCLSVPRHDVSLVVGITLLRVRVWVMLF